LEKFKISIIGPEATGKTTLSKQLAEHYKTIWLPEYARYYVENLNRKYNYNDVVHIAEKQIELEKDYLQKSGKFLFLDTDLIIIKVWLLFVYNKTPDWIDEEIEKNKADLYLLCFYDLPWEYDKVRENGGENRKILFDLYENELKLKHFTYKLVKGNGDNRLNFAVNEINIFFRY
jgi:NadR type nicotinamide-nucleotide adenylyltransferase